MRSSANRRFQDADDGDSCGRIDRTETPGYLANASETDLVSVTEQHIQPGRRAGIGRITRPKASESVTAADCDLITERLAED